MAGDGPLKGVERISYFSDAERPAVIRLRALRTRIVRPLMGPLERLGVTADHLTYIGTAFFLPVALFFRERPALAILFMAVSIVIDGLDGPYARLTGQASPAGALADIACDHVGLVVIVLSTIYYGLAEPVVATVYLLMYVVSLALSIAQNALDVPVQPNLRSRYFLYLLYVFYVLTGANYFTEAMVVFATLNSASALVGYLRLRRRLRSL